MVNTVENYPIINTPFLYKYGLKIQSFGCRYCSDLCIWVFGQWGSICSHILNKEIDMTYTAQDLITRSWFLSGIVARNLQIPTGDQIYDGLNMLNDLLNFKQIETDLIPYWQYITFNATPQQEYYFLPYVAAIEESTFNINVVRYPMVQTSRSNYFGSSRVDNIYTLPFSWNYERSVGGGTYGMYFIPDEPYPIKMKAKIFLVDVTLQTDLQNVTESFVNTYNVPNYTPYTFINNGIQGYDTSYTEYLRYALARFMCSEYGVGFNPESEKIFQSYQRKLMYMDPPDLSGKKLSILYADNQVGYNWGDVNIGRGFRPQDGDLDIDINI